jgi:hypothetical protein
VFARIYDSLGTSNEADLAISLLTLEDNERKQTVSNGINLMSMVEVEQIP